MNIKNPVLTGFNPDPSITRAGDYFYMAVSTFEWFPGVLIYRSKNLASWELVTRPLNRKSQLDIAGVADSCGVWAPCLTYDSGVFYLVYTIVRSIKGIWRDMRNYLVTCESVTGEWSEPVYLNGTGQDPSMFHDSDGRKWLVNAQWEYINGRNIFSGIVAQEYSLTEKKLIGEAVKIFGGTEHGFTEAPHLYKKDGYYYLITAEGGTWYEHCVTVARSKELLGPYEVHPDNPMLTSYGNNELILQKAGHGDLIETENGWYMPHLCGRPLKPNGRCTLGRETAIQKIEWRENGWPYMANGGRYPENELQGLDGDDVYDGRNIGRDNFDGDTLNINYQTLRIPQDSAYFNLTERKGYLRLYGRESLSSTFYQTLLARRVQSFCYRAQTAMEFNPLSSRDMAGLIVYYNTDNYVYLCMSNNESAGRCLRVITCIKGETEEPTGLGLPLDKEQSRIYLRVNSYGNFAQLSYSADEAQWIEIGEQIEIDKLSDDYIGGKSFTGTFIGICCQAMSGNNIYADFDYFEYTED